MMTVLNQGGPIWSNLVVIAIALYLLPIYLLAADIKQTSLVVLKSCLYPISCIWNASVITIAVVMGTGLLGLAMARLNK